MWGNFSLLLVYAFKGSKFILLQHYNKYSAEDFCKDSYFINYVKYASQQDIAAWQAWLNKKPENINEFKEAVLYIKTVLKAERVFPKENAEELLLLEIKKEIHQKIKRKAKVLLIRRFSGVAAACILLFAMGFTYYNLKVTVATGYGQYKTVSLPDGSIIKLNAHSSITYFRAWQYHKNREVWLSGEALFKVKHINANPNIIKRGEAFIAHVGNLNIKVLGTVFNVKHYRTKTMVALLEGKIQITKNNSLQSVIMKKGDVMITKGESLHLTTIDKLSSIPQAWINKQIMSSGMTVAEIIEDYENTYGYKIILDKPELKLKRIDGTISLSNPQTTLFMLANILNTNITQQGDTIYLNSK